MKAEKKKRLEASGFKVGSIDEFLELSAVERAIVELRIQLADEVRRRRRSLRCSQTELARRVGSSQSRIAKIEASQADVSLDLLIRTLLATGAKPQELGRVIAAG